MTVVGVLTADTSTLRKAHSRVPDLGALLPEGAVATAAC